MYESFPIVDVSAWLATDNETMGSKPKVWLASPEGESWLFKKVIRHAERAEDWTEKVAAEFARMIRVPAASVELATYQADRGVLSRSITQGRDLVHGNELLFDLDPGYAKHEPRPDEGYTLSAVQQALAVCVAPPGWTTHHRMSGFDVFTGYVVLDALIANSDRHHENWAVLVDRFTGDRALSPTFDHASSFGFNLSDAEREKRLTTTDAGYSVRHWATRGRSHFEGRPRLVELACEALRMCSADAARFWLDQVRDVDLKECEAILRRIPDSRVSEVARTFAGEVLSVNRRRLLDAFADVT